MKLILAGEYTAYSEGTADYLKENQPFEVSESEAKRLIETGCFEPFKETKTDKTADKAVSDTPKKA